MIKPYKLKHVPTGLYYQPHKHGGSNLSKKGKIYQTGIHGLSSAYKNGNNTFTVQCAKDSNIYKITNDILIWSDCRYAYRQLIALTNINDWKIEEL